MTDETLQLEGFLPYRLSVLTNRISSTLAQVYADQFNLTIPQWRVMAVLGERPGLSANEVVERTAMDKVAVSRAVAGLVKAGYVRKTMQVNDKRRSHLRLSARGRRVYTRIVPFALAYERRLTSSLTASEQKLFARLIDKISQQAGHIPAIEGAARSGPAARTRPKANKTKRRRR